MVPENYHICIFLFSTFLRLFGRCPLQHPSRLLTPMSPDAMASDNFIGTSIFRHCWILLDLQSVFWTAFRSALIRLAPSYITALQTSSSSWLVSSWPVNLGGWCLLLHAGVKEVRLPAYISLPCSLYTPVAPTSIFSTPSEVNFLRPAY